VFSKLRQLKRFGNLYEYQGHRTTKLGCLVLSFVNIETEEEAVAFFNVDVRRQRGPKER